MLAWKSAEATLKLCQGEIVQNTELYKSMEFRPIYQDDFRLQCVIINKSDHKKTVKSRVEDSAVDYWAVHVGGTRKNNKHVYTMIKWF